MTTLIVLAVAEESVYYGPEIGTIEPGEIPTTLFLPRTEYVALGGPQRVVVTVEAAPAAEPPVEP